MLAKPMASNKKSKHSVKTECLDFLYDLLIFIFLASSDKDLYKETIISNMMKENGKAATMSILCKASRPSADNKMTAMADCARPQITFTILDGSNEPFVVCMPNTNVAESAEVMKNVLIKITAIIERTIDNGSSLNTANNVSSVFKPVKSANFC